MAYFIPNTAKMSLAGIPVAPFFGSSPWVTGFEMSMSRSFSPVYEFVMAPGAARSLTSDFVISYSPLSGANLPAQTIVDIRNVGLNGCYPNSLQSLNLTNNTVFPVYVVGNASGVGLPSSAPSAGFVVATSDDFLPSGYDSYCRVGLIRISSTLSIMPWIQEGSGLERYYHFQLPYFITNTTTTSFTQYDLTSNNGPIPPLYDTTFNASILLTNTVNGQTLRISTYDTDAAQVFLRAPVGTISVSQTLLSGINASGNGSISIRAQALSQSIFVEAIGFKDSFRNAVF